MATREFTIPCKGIVAYAEVDWRMEDLLTREPDADEVLVEMIATGMCHTDLSCFGGIFPRVLGHEGAGRVIKVGSSQAHHSLHEGDLVILSAASCQTCHYCRTGNPAYCLQHAALTLHANEPNFVLARDPSQVIGGGYFRQSSFASPSPVKASAATRVTSMVKDAAELVRYAPLGCGIMTGAGAITHVAQRQRDDVLAVVGLGGVGLAAVCAARHLGIKNVIAIDVIQSRIELAKSLGAAHGLLSTKEALDKSGKDLQGAIKSITPHELGCTHILDTTPSIAVLSACLEALRNRGTVLQVGIKPKDSKIEVDALMHMAHGRRLVGVIEGDRDPAEALPELVEWCKTGTLPIEKLFTEFSVDNYEEAREKMENGEVVKGVLVW